MSAKVSVIVPVYNTEKYLRKCMDSLVNQSLQDIEIICFNDASTDSSLSILEEYAGQDNRVNVIDSKANIKQGGGRNAGLRMATADYVMFVDSDDWVETDYMERLYKAAITHDADVVVSDYYLWTDQEQRNMTLLDCELSSGVQLLKNQYINRGGVVWATLYRKSLIFDHDLLFPENIFYEDNAIAIGIFLAANKIVKIDEPLYFYRRHNQSTTGVNDKYRIFDLMSTSIMAIDHIKRIGRYNEFKSSLDNRFLNQLYLKVLPELFERFKPIPYDKIRYIRDSVKKYLTKKEINAYIASRSRRERLMLQLLKISPRLSAMSWIITGRAVGMLR